LAHTSQLTLNELPRKIKNEKRLARDLREFFRQMGDELNIRMAVTGVVPDLSGFNRDLEAVLRANYRRTARDFKFTARDRFDLSRDISSGQIDQTISTFIDRTSVQVTSQIMDTTADVARAADRDVRIQAEEDGRNLTDAETAILVGAAFFSRNRNRVETIAQTEVQNIAESSKQIEGSVLNEQGELETEKVWDAILDGKTRPAHARADGQRRGINDAFDVGGERLMFPRDTSLGASAGNVIGCRCSSQLVKI